MLTLRYDLTNDSFSDALAFVGKFIGFFCCSSFKVYTFNFSQHFEGHTCETCRINDVTKAIICVPLQQSARWRERKVAMSSRKEEQGMTGKV